MEHGSFSLTLVSIFRKREMYFSLVLLKGFCRCFTVFCKRTPPPWPASSLAAGNAEVFASPLLSLSVILLALSAYFCSHILLISKVSKINFSLVLCKSYCINFLTPSKDFECFCYLIHMGSVLHFSRSLCSASLFTGPLFSIHFQHIFFLDLESSFGSFCSSNNLDHTSCNQKTNAFISLVSEASWVTEHWKSGAEIPDCLHGYGKITSEINAALPSRGLLHIKEQNIHRRHAHWRVLTSFAFVCYQSTWWGFVYLQYKQVTYHVRCQTSPEEVSGSSCVSSHVM